MDVEVEAWLRGLGLEEHAPAFREHAVTADLLPTLTGEDLRELGIVKVGDRRRVLNAIARLAEAPEALAVPPPVPTGFDRPERRQLTILVCDIAGSTALATRLDPEDLRSLVGRFQQACADAVRQFGGFVGPFLGDAVMAYFGFPQALENDAESALRAGLAIVRRIAEPGAFPDGFEVRIGVATGRVVVGRLHDGDRADAFTVVGDTPNLAVRLQSLAGANRLVCGAVTRALAGELFAYRSLGKMAVKGFDAPVQLFEVEREADVESRFVATRGRILHRLVGRAQERELLRDRWATALRGEGQAVVLTGQPGIGKSRLVRSLVDDLDRRTIRVISLQCSPLFAQSPLYPVFRHLDAAAGVTPADLPEARLAKIHRLLEVQRPGAGLAEALAPLLVDPSHHATLAGPERLRAEGLRALVRLILGERGDRPTLVVLEDVHWIDPSTRELGQHLLAALGDKPALLLVTARPEADLRWTQAADPTLLPLGKLNRTQAAELLQEIFEDRAISIPVARRIIDRTDGVPLFIEEVCRSLLEGGALQPDADARISPDTVLGAVPVSLNDVLLSRLDRDPLARSVAQVASVIGREFRLELLRAIHTGSAAELDAGLEALVAADLVHPVADASAGIFAFKHGLMHQATYETLLLRDRQQLHLRIVETLPDVLPTFVRARPEILARHLSLAGEHRRAAAQWLLAGRQAQARGAYEETSEHLRAGLAAVAQLPPSDARDEQELALRIALAQALRAARFTSGDEALDACREARRLAERLERSEDLLLVLRLEFGILFNRPDVAAAEATARTFTTAPLLACLPEAAALGYQALGKVEFFKGEFATAYVTMERAMEGADRLRAPHLLTHYQYPVSAMVYRAFAAHCLGRRAEADDLAEAALAISRDGSAFTHSLTLANLLIRELMAGGSARTAAMLEELRGIALARGAPFWVDLVGFHDGWALTRAGAADSQRGLDLMRRALATFAANAVEVEVPFYQAVLAQRLIAHDAVDEADGRLADAEARIERTGEAWPLAFVLALRAEVAARRGDAVAAGRLRDAAYAVCNRQDAAVWRERLDAAGRAAAIPAQ